MSEHLESFAQSTSKDYLRSQMFLREVIEAEEADVEGGLLDRDNKDLRYGCWFGKFPLAAESRICPGLTLGSLQAKGVSVLTPLIAEQLDCAEFSERVPIECWSGVTLTRNEAEVWNAVLENCEEVRKEGWRRLAESRCWILDVTLVVM